MIYGYIRVSTDRQTVENQRYEINRFCEKEGIKIEKWIEETVSGTVKVENRLLGKLLKKMKKEDIIIASELSRLGRSLLMIMSILNQCMRAQQKTEIIYQPVHISFIRMIIKEIPKRTLKNKRKALTKAPAGS